MTNQNISKHKEIITGEKWQIFTKTKLFLVNLTILDKILGRVN